MTVPPVAAFYYPPAPRKATPRNRCAISRDPGSLTRFRGNSPCRPGDAP
jgi:hypothetical protein